MTPHDRTGGAGSEVVAASTAGTVPGPPVPESTAGAVDPHLAVPAVPELTAGAADPRTAPAVSENDPGWGAALSGRRSHYVPVWTKREQHNGRPTGDGLCGFPGLIDERGLQVGGGLAKCRDCFDTLEGKPRPDLGEWL